MRLIFYNYWVIMLSENSTLFAENEQKTDYQKLKRIWPARRGG